MLNYLTVGFSHSLCLLNVIARIHGHAKIAHFPMSYITKAWEAQGHRPSIGSDDKLSLEMFNFCMGMGSSFYPVTYEKNQGSHGKNT